MPVKILNGIFQGNDMGIPCPVDFIYDTRKGGTFSAARRSCHKYHSLGQPGHIDNALWQMKLSGIRKFKPYHPDDAGQGPPLAEYAGTELSQIQIPPVLSRYFMSCIIKMQFSPECSPSIACHLVFFRNPDIRYMM